MYYPTDDQRTYEFLGHNSEPFISPHYEYKTVLPFHVKDTYSSYESTIMGEGIVDVLKSIGSKILERGLPHVATAGTKLAVRAIENKLDTDKAAKLKELEKEKTDKSYKYTKSIDRSEILNLLKETKDPKERLELIKLLKP